MEVNKKEQAEGIFIIYKLDKDGKYIFNDWALHDLNGKILTGAFQGKNVKDFNQIETVLEEINENNQPNIKFSQKFSRSDYVGYVVNMGNNRVKLGVMPEQLYRHSAKATAKTISHDLIKNGYIYPDGKPYLAKFLAYTISDIVSKYVKIEISKDKKAEYYPGYFIEEKKIFENIKKYDIDYGKKISETVNDVYKRSLVRFNDNRKRTRVANDSTNNIPSVHIPPEKTNQSNQPLQEETLSTEERTITKEELKEIIEDLQKKYIGQEECARQLIESIYFNLAIINKLDKESFKRQKASILLDGPTGTGKTAILTSIAEKLNVPILVTSIKNYTPQGYRGVNLDQVLVKLLIKAGGDLEKAERSIVYFDEFDKLGLKNEDSGAILSEMVQDELLTFIGGDKIFIKYNDQDIEFDTSRLTIICGGAFTNLRDNKIEDLKTTKNKIGFESSEEIKDDKKTYTITSEDIISQGIKKELYGRLTTKMHTKAYSVEDFKRIINESTLSPLNDLIELFKSQNKKVTITDEFIQLCAEEALKTGTGARALQEIFANFRNSMLHDLIFSDKNEYELNKSEYEKYHKSQERSFN